MSRRRTVIEGSVVAVVSVAIATVFIVVTHPWASHPPKLTSPTTQSSQH